MASTITKKVFDSEEASAMVKDMRATFDSGKTRSYEWKASQLKALMELTEQHEQEIVRSLYSDLSKSETEAYIQEKATITAVCALFQYYYTFPHK